MIGAGGGGNNLSSRPAMSSRNCLSIARRSGLLIHPVEEVRKGEPTIPGTPRKTMNQNARGKKINVSIALASKYLQYSRPLFSMLAQDAFFP